MAACVTPRLFVAFLCFVLICIGVDPVHCRNFDARFSVIKKGPDDSYFGFSVSEHQYIDERDALQNLFIIGAPKEMRRIKTKVAGGSVYKCDAGTSDESDCSLVTSVDPSTQYGDSENVKDQWLGVSVNSAGVNKKAVACAHRYISDNAALGVCYTLLPDLEFDSMYKPCYGKSTTSYMEDFGLCQAGMATGMGKDDALVMGAPGSVFWRGTIFQVNITDEVGASTAEKISPFLSPKNLEPGKQASPTEVYSYNGYAVAMGRFDKSRTLYYVSGAPRFGSVGRVVFFNATSDSTLHYEDNHIVDGKLEFSGFGSSLLTVDMNNDGFDDLIVGAPYYYKRNHGGAFYVYLGGPNMITEDTPVTEVASRDMGEEECKQLQCEHAMFGISLAKLGDINKDGFQDFAVGAPYEGNGAVYIYHGSDAKEGFNTKYVQRITAEDLPGPTLRSFGYSLFGGLDLDYSSYPDLLVGAYESDAVALIRSRPIVKLIPSISVAPESVDLDSKDGCPVPNLPAEYKDRLCVTITLCLSFNASILVTPEVVYKLEAEPQRRLTRVELVGAQDEDKRIVEGKTMNLDQSKEVCASEVALLKSKFEDKLNPIDFQFTFGLSTDNESPDPYPQSAVQTINNFPYLDTDGADLSQVNSKTAPVQFVMECGDDNLCHSNLQFNAQLSNLTRNDEGMYEIIISNQNILYVEMSVWNTGEPAYLTKVYIQTPENIAYLGTITEDGVSCQRHLEDDTIVVCDQIGNPLRDDRELYFVVKLNVPRYYAENPDLNHNITAWVNTSSTEQTLANDKHVMDFRVINKAEVTLGANTAPDSAILCKGEPRGASAIKDKDETYIGAAVTHNYIINNQGPGVVSESYISIKWPYEVAGKDGAGGKHLLYLMRMPKIEGSVVKCNDDDIRRFVNPLGIKEIAAPEVDAAASTDPAYAVSRDGQVQAKSPASEETTETTVVSRQRRETADRKRRASGRVVTMSCQDNTARCFEYKCKLGKLDKSDYVKISFEARLWESTLLSDYRKSENVEIISWGQVTVPEKLKIVQDTSDDSRRAITRAIPDFLESAGGKIQWWIILVAVLVGLLVLLVLIFILYKMGFFRRRRMEDMQMYKAEKKQQAMLQEYDGDGV